jgi:adenosyl cobinamide kinase/adenosyl cobinamide phosphate guanylyltransferase
MGRPLVLVLGGTRSGKSAFGVRRAGELAGDRSITYLATAIPGDPELDSRIDRHRRHRPAAWTTVEVRTDLPAALRSSGGGAAVLVDGLTLWLSALWDSRPIDIDALLAGPIEAGLTALAAHEAPVVVVSDEIGLGMVPMDPIARSFRDLQGIVHQRLASVADEVVFMVAGLPLAVKTATP